MNVRELIERLEKIDPDRLVFMSKDPEGNAYAPLADIWEDASSDYTWREVGLEKLTPELIEQGYSEDDVIEGIPSIVLWPGDWGMGEKVPA